MNIYLVDNKETCSIIAQLIRLNLECSALHWSINSEELPDNVIDALKTIEDYVRKKIDDICDEKIAELSDKEQNYIISVMKHDPILNEIIGSCIITGGDEAEKVLKIIKKDIHLDKLKSALASGKNIVIF